MEPALEAIKGGGGSIKVGATGTISALMSKELDPLTKPIARPKTNEASSSRASMGPLKNHHHRQKGLEALRKTKNHTGSQTHQIPMLMADDSISIDGTPIRKPRSVMRGPAGVVDIVDIKCGSDRKWVNPIKDRLKKLNFSKLSKSII